MTLSCADLRWDELTSIIASLRGENLQDKDIQMWTFSLFVVTLIKPSFISKTFSI